MQSAPTFRLPITRAILIGTLALLTLTAVASAQSITYTIDSVGDGSNTGPNTACNDGTGHCTLRAALEAANSHAGADAIDFNLRAGSVINLTKALPVISDSVSITASGTNPVTVRRDTGGDYRIFETTADVITLSGLTITNGRVFGPGAGVANSGSGTLNITGCTISGNSAVNDMAAPVPRGGGVANVSYGAVNLIDCIVTGNSALVGGGLALSTRGSASVIGCTFSGNTANEGRGGAIHTSTGYSSVEILYSTLSNNSARAGGAISNSTLALQIVNCTLSGNSAIGDGANEGGGAIFGNSGHVAVTNSTIVNNSAAVEGGGVCSASATINMQSTIVAMNTAGSAGPDVRVSGSGKIQSFGFNLVGKNDGAEAAFATGNPNPNKDVVGTSVSPLDPGLDPDGLQNNGGPTATIGLLSTSPAVDKGTGTGFSIKPGSDQRGLGFPRTFDYPAHANAAGGDGTDIGAYELLAPFSVSRKFQGGAPYDVDLTLPGSVGVESRAAGESGGHQVIVSFPGPVTVAGASVTAGAGSVSSFTTNGSQATVNLTGVADAQVLAFTLSGVNGGAVSGDATVWLGVLLGDSNNDGDVNSGDAQQTRTRSGQTTDATNFRSDYNLDGLINSGDASVVKARSGTSIP